MSTLFTNPKSYTSIIPGSNFASLTLLTGLILRFMFDTILATSAAYSIAVVSPITIGLHLSYNEKSASVLIVISGPFPNGSPIVIPIIGLLFWLLFIVFPPYITSPELTSLYLVINFYCQIPQT